MLTDQLLAKLQPLIGFRTDPVATQEESNNLTDELKVATSGITVDQCHELLTLATLFATFRGNQSNLGDYLKRTRDDAIRSLLTNLDTRLAEVGLAARLLNPTTLFKPLSSPVGAITKSGRIVGLQLRVIARDVTVSLDRLLFSVSVANGFVLTLTTQETGETKAITPTGSWQDTALQLRTGFTYLLTYNENDLGLGNSALNTVGTWPKVKPGCKGCAAGCIASYVAIDAVVVGNTGTVNLTNDTNYGLNLVISAEGDVSGRLVDNPKRLLPLYRQQIAMSFLEKVAYSTRKNGATEDAIQGALFALTDKDNANRVPVLYDRAMASLIKSMQAEASPALDVDDSDDITWGSI